MHLSRVDVFPIKSLCGLSLSEARITPGGILEHDRTYAIFDGEGRLVNGKRTPRVHQIQATYDKDVREVCLAERGAATPARFPLGDTEAVARWLSDFFGFRVALQYEPVRGFPDDCIAFGPTIVSEASLNRVAGWFGALPVDDVRRRFRTNLELAVAQPFEEDRLFGGPDERTAFQIGAVRLSGHNPCQRCVVPTRDPFTGDVRRGFQKTFAEQRERELPPWTDARRFNHYYRFAVNTSIDPSEGGKILRVGDPVVT